MLLLSFIYMRVFVFVFDVSLSLSRTLNNLSKLFKGSYIYVYTYSTNIFFLFYKKNTDIVCLGYDIFLLVVLFVACCFIIRVQCSYNEGKCLFGTAIGLLMVWVTWLICFMVMQPENRDTIVAFGTIATAYLIILGILVPRAYCMLSHPPRRKHFGPKFDCVDLPADSISNTIIRQVSISSLFNYFFDILILKQSINNPRYKIQIIHVA